MNNGGPAFPVDKDTWALIEDQVQRCQEPSVPMGLTVRDLYAGMALQGLLARGETEMRYTVATSYEYADAMLKEREGR